MDFRSKIRIKNKSEKYKNFKISKLSQRLFVNNIDLVQRSLFKVFCIIQPDYQIIATV